MITEDARTWTHVHVSDKTSDSLPLYTHRQWLSEHAATGEWLWSNAIFDTIMFYIKDPEVATLFKLTFVL